MTHLATVRDLFDLLKNQAPELDAERRQTLYTAILRTVDEIQARELTPELLDAGVAAWFGVEKIEPEKKILRERVRAVITAATTLRDTTIHEDLSDLMRRAWREGEVVTIRLEAVPPLAMGRSVMVANITQATAAQLAFRAECGEQQ